MLSKESVDALRKLRGHVEYLSGDCVDDPEDVMSEIACDAPILMKAIDEVLQVQKAHEVPGRMPARSDGVAGRIFPFQVLAETER